MRLSVLANLAAVIVAACPWLVLAQPQVGPTGLWSGEAQTSSPVRGEVIIDGRVKEWSARVAGLEVAVEVASRNVRFVLPEGKGRFDGQLSPDSATIVGHWVQPAGIVSYQPRATALNLRRSSPSLWRGIVTPLDEVMHFVVHIRRDSSGSLLAVIRNPESNRYGNATFQVSQQGDSLVLSDRRSEIRGRIDAGSGDLLLPLLGSAPAVRLSQIDPRKAVGFYPRVPWPAAYSYERPVRLDDGWATASLQDERIDPEPIRALMQSILDAEPTDSRSVRIHSVLIARGGKLVVEEYFYGFDRARPHDTRSAGKTLAPLLVGVARHHGAKVEPSTSVYDLFPEYRPFANWDERKTKLTVEHLMTMTSGLASDDNDASSPGEEGRMQSQQAQPNWYEYTLDLPMARDPGGTTAIYSSASLNMVGGIAGKVARMWNAELFRRYVAEPLQFGTYHLNLTPSGEAYMGGGTYLLPRDALKLGQLYLSGGEWNGRRVVGSDWVTWSTAHHSTFARPVVDIDLNHQYGYGWHIHHFVVGGHTYREYAAEGNGGQFVMVVPELDMVVAINGGNYGSAWYRWGLEVLPKYLIPATAKQGAR